MVLMPCSKANRKMCKELYKARRHQPGSTAHTTTGTIIVSTLTLLSYTHSQTIIVSRPANTTAMAAAKYDTDMPAGQICNSDDITIFLKTDISATITMDAPITGSSIPWWVVRFSIVCSDRGLRVTEDGRRKTEN